jgi:protein-tyrosine phosphatase
VIDIHTHILPGIDDGVKTEDDAVEFARLAAGDGVRTIVATPHCRDGFFVNERADVLERTRSLQARLAREGVDVELLPGAEVHICPDLTARIRDGRAPTLGDNGKTLLLELSLTQYPVELENLIFQLKLAGIVPILAHPERIRYFEDDIAHYEAVVRLGAYGQITTGSLLGTFGRKTAEFSRELVRKGLIHVLASDAHNVRGRPPLLAEAVERLAGMVGEDLARKMADDVPRALLRGEDVELPRPERPERSRSFLSRLFRR